MKQAVLSLFFLILVLVPVSSVSFARESGSVSKNTTDLSTLNVLDLKTAATVALERNPSMTAALARVEQALARLAQARSAYWPYLNAEASYTRVETSDRAHENNLSLARLFDPLATIDNPDDYYQAGLTATWVLFNGFERKYSNQTAQLGRKQSESLNF